MEDRLKKDKLRDELYNKYFEVTEGVKADEFVSKINFIRDKYEELKDLVYNGSRKMRSAFFYKSPSNIKKVNIRGIDYLVIHIDIYHYIVIDLNNKIVITDLNQIRNIFGEEYFDEIVMFKLYCFEKYTGDIDRLNEFYEANKNIFSFDPSINYLIQIGEAYTNFYISLNNKEAQLGFYTPNQFLYETLFLDGDLNPSGMQDAHQRMSKERMQEMFDTLKSIIIPYEVIPKELFEMHVFTQESKLKRLNNN